MISKELQKNLDDVFEIFINQQNKKNILSFKSNTNKLFNNLLKKQKNKILTHDKTNSPIFAIEFSVFINSAYYRLFDLLNGVIYLCAKKNSLSSLILLRQVYETIAYIRWFLDKVEDAIMKKNIDNYVKFSTFVYGEIFVDTKITNDHQFVFEKLENIKTAIRYYKGQEKLIFNDQIDNDLMDKLYAKLSNILHPNAEGLARFYISGNIFSKDESPQGYLFDNYSGEKNFYIILINILKMSMEIDIYLNRIKIKINKNKKDFYDYIYQVSKGRVREYLKDMRTKFIKNKGVYYQENFFKEKENN